MTRRKLRPREPVLSRLTRWCEPTSKYSLLHRPWSLPYRRESPLTDWGYGTIATNAKVGILWLQDLDCPPPPTPKCQKQLAELPFGPAREMATKVKRRLWQGTAITLRRNLQASQAEWTHLRVAVEDKQRYTATDHRTVRIDWLLSILTALAAPADAVQVLVCLWDGSLPMLCLDTPRFRLRQMLSNQVEIPYLNLPGLCYPTLYGVDNATDHDE